MSDMNKIKNHPGFMPFGHANVKANSGETQSDRDKRITAQEVKSDASKGNK